MSISKNLSQKLESSEFSFQANRLIHWCKNDALPFWAKHGIDSSGGFHESLCYDGSPDLFSKRRVRVQARQCYVYSLANSKAWFAASDIASNHAWKYLSQQGLQSGESFPGEQFSGCAHLLNIDGSLQDSTRDTYDQAFLLLASAWHFRATNSPHAYDLIYATTAFLNEHFKSNAGGWVENCNNSLPRRQNPHMHLFEAFLASYEATYDDMFLELADEIFGLFKTSFYNLPNHCVLEYFDEVWTPVNIESARVEPGHMMEWCWLLEWYGRLRKRQVKQYVDSLYYSAVSSGLNLKTGFLINEYSLDGTISDGKSRLWPQTEFIKACISRYRLGHSDALQEAAIMIDKLLTHFLDTPMKGGWYDCLDKDGNIASSGMPASTFYHLACAVREVDMVIKGY